MVFFWSAGECGRVCFVDLVLDGTHADLTVQGDGSSHTTRNSGKLTRTGAREVASLARRLQRASLLWRYPASGLDLTRVTLTVDRLRTEFDLPGHGGQLPDLLLEAAGLNERLVHALGRCRATDEVRPTPGCRRIEIVDMGTGNP